jgi:hypothetical protein
MPRIVPSQVVDFIDSIPIAASNGLVRMNSVGVPGLSSTLDLVDLIPDELLTMDQTSFAAFVYARAQIRDILTTWRANHTAGHSLQPFQFSISGNPLAVIRGALAKCSDESPAPSTSQFNFISDLDLQTNLRNDMGSINRALSNGEWKAATVLAGSVIEALLLWALLQHTSTDATNAASSLVSSQTLTKQPDPNPERWDLHEYTEVSQFLGIIKTDTAKQTRLAREFRNLIHPGRSQRLGQKCDRATALSAVAGAEHVVRDLTP